MSRLAGILNVGKWIRLGLRPSAAPHRFSKLLELYEANEASSEVVLLEEIEVLLRSQGPDLDTAFLIRLRSLVRLRQLHEGRFSKRFELQSVFVPGPNSHWDIDPSRLAQQSITEAAGAVAQLYWKVLDAAMTESGELQRPATELLNRVFARELSLLELRREVERVTDVIQRDGGLPFLILNWIRREKWTLVRPLGARLLAEEWEMDEDLRAALYWLTELSWFAKDEDAVRDHEGTIRNLYHLCFTNPERAGFLEVDSQFFAQFETVNEIAREGLLFKETLIEKILGLWQEFTGHFDREFQFVLETMTGRRNKVYDSVEDWLHFWKREAERFGRDYLYLVEGNLAYAQSDFEAAHEYFGKALKENPNLRAARLNRLFSSARMGDKRAHESAISDVLDGPGFSPGNLSVIGNSYLLIGNEVEAEWYFEKLKAEKGWGRKAEYYTATFCYEHGLFELALKYARLAHEKNPLDAAIAYQLSLCFNALGEKEAALSLVKQVQEPTPDWLHYYRFQLERDSGRHGEAQATLMNIPADYFSDPEALEEAMEFAKAKQDLGLLRYLRSQKR